VSAPRPPRLWSTLARWLVRGSGAEFVLGDLAEEYALTFDRAGQAAADALYRRQVIATVRDWLRTTSFVPAERLLHEARYAVRVLRRAPGFTSATVLTLGLGLGGAAAVMALAESILRPLPFPEPDQLVAVWETREGDQRSVSPADYLDWRREARSFSALAAHLTRSASITVGGTASRVRVAVVSGNFFEVLGVSPTLGRGFDPALDTDFPELLTVISHETWRSVFQGAPDIIGRTFLVEEQSYEIVGVAPLGMSVPEAGVAAWLRSRSEAPELRFLRGDLTQVRDAWYFEVLGRLRPDVTMAMASEEMATIAGRLELAYPESNEGHGAIVRSLLEQTVVGFRSSLMALAISVVLLLIAAAVNVTHLALGRQAVRTADCAVRVALGASKAALVRQVWIEGALLGLGGSLVGLALATGTIEAGLTAFGADLPRADEVALRWSSVGWVLLAGTVIGIVVSLGAFVRGRPWAPPSARLRGRGWVGAWAANGLIAAQVAAAVTLLASAGLLGRSVYRLSNVDLGFAEADVATVRVAMPDAGGHPYQERVAMYEEIRAGLAAMPNVRAASFGTQSPLNMGQQAGLRVVGWERATDPGSVGWQPIDVAYFAAFGIPVISGRGFDSADRSGTRDVGVINESLRRSVFPNEDPVGRQVTIGLDGHDRQITIVGVVADTRTQGPTLEAGPVLFRPIEQTDRFSGESVLFVTDIANASAADVLAIRQKINALRPEFPVYSDAIGTGLAEPFRRTRASLLGVLGVFAATALLLGAVGVYGVAAHAMRHRRREIGVRIALGADTTRVLTGIMSEGLLRAAVGVPFGLVLSVLVGRSLEGLLFDVPPFDPVTLGGVSVAVLMVTAMALWIPAYQAARTDPAAATRAD